MAAVTLAFFLTVCYPLQFFKNSFLTRKHMMTQQNKTPGQTNQKLTFLKTSRKVSDSTKTKNNLMRPEGDLKAITMRKSCLEPCFPRCFGASTFLWTQHPERISYESAISRNSSAVTHCRVITLLFYRETAVLECLV